MGAKEWLRKGHAVGIIPLPPFLCHPSYATHLLQKRVDLGTIIPPSSGSAKWLRGRSRQALRAGQSGGVGALECEDDGDLYACGACDGGKGEEFAG